MMNEDWYTFLEQIRAARKKLKSPAVVWYRGHSSDKYHLVPSLHRHVDGLSREKALFGEFYRSYSRLFEKRANDWETLFDMQHHGIPTRLLDWTEALGVAVAFAVLDRFENDRNAEIFVLNPLALNRYSGLDEVKEIPSKGFKYKAVYWENQPFAAQYPIAIAPRLQSNRMVAQRATFTVHGSSGDGLDQQCPKAIVKVPLKASALQGAREFLEHANITSYSIFPDILGMARHISRKHFG